MAVSLLDTGASQRASFFCLQSKIVEVAAVVIFPSENALNGNVVLVVSAPGISFFDQVFFVIAYAPRSTHILFVPDVVESDNRPIKISVQNVGLFSHSLFIENVEMPLFIASAFPFLMPNLHFSVFLCVGFINV